MPYVTTNDILTSGFFNECGARVSTKILLQVPYVTTNDILTSGFFNECGARVGMMGMDCRSSVWAQTCDLALEARFAAKRLRCQERQLSR